MSGGNQSGGGGAVGYIGANLLIRGFVPKPAGLVLLLKPPHLPHAGGPGLKIIQAVRPRRPYVGSPPHYSNPTGLPPYESSILQPKTVRSPGPPGVVTLLRPPKAQQASATSRPKPLVISQPARSRAGLVRWAKPPLAPPGSTSAAALPASVRVAYARRSAGATAEPIWIRPPRSAPPAQTHIARSLLLPAWFERLRPYRGFFHSYGPPLVAVPPGPPLGGSSMTCSGITIFEAIQGVVSLQEQIQGIVLLED